MGTKITVTECDDGSDLRARVGDTIEVHLPENAAGGYRWALADDGGLLEFIGTSANYPHGVVGSAGEAVFAVRVRAAGNARLSLTYGRSWEGEAGICKHFSVSVHATDA
jgi:inhibitor of cysteine peptidase